MSKSKNMISVAAISLSTLCTATFASAASLEIDSASLKAVNSSVLSRIEPDNAYDINNDKMIDVFDSVSARFMINNQSETIGEAKTSHYSAISENVKLIGRNCINDGITWLVQSGSAVEFNVNAETAEITINGDYTVNSPDANKPRYAVFVDDMEIFDGLLSEKSVNVKLFSGKTARNAKVKVILLSEGVIGVGDIAVTSANSKPVQPSPKKTLQIEFIGDSITCAYGVEAESQSCSFSTSTENFMKSYAYLTAQFLNADYSTCCYSGHGIISGYSTGQRVTESILPDYYSFAGKNKEYAQVWDFKTNPNDVVVINLGTNDSSFLKYGFDEYSPEFIEKYEAFLADVRSKNPDACIICTVGTMGGKEVYDLIVKACDNFINKTGDKKISYFLSTEQNSNDGYGADWHPSVITQEKSSYMLADKICEVLGIESSKIGLNTAENADYELIIDKENIYASSYLGYDKAFWISTTLGGDELSDIYAKIGKIELKGGGKYKISYTCKGTKADIPFAVKLKNDSDVFYESTDTMSDSETNFTDTFTVSENSDAFLYFYVGGALNVNITLSNLSITRIE